MKKKTIMFTIIAAVLAILYLLQPFLGENFFGEPVKGVVHNPGLPQNPCDTVRVMTIKCYRFEHICNRKHLALNDRYLCLSAGQKIRIDHTFKATEGDYEITAKILCIVGEDDCPKE